MHDNRESKNNQRPLLEVLSEETGCLFLSDLRLSEKRPAIAQALPTIEASLFPDAEWEEAFLYLTGSKQSFSSPKEAKRRLLRWMQERG